MSEKDILYPGDDTAQFSGLLEATFRGGCFRLNRALNLRVPVSWRIERFRRNEDFHLLLVLDGRGSYFLGDAEIPVPLRKGSIVFVGPGMAHSSCADSRDPPHILPLRFGHCRPAADAAVGAPADESLASKGSRSFAEACRPLAVALDHCDLGHYAPLFQGLKELYDRSGRGAEAGPAGEGSLVSAAASGSDAYRGDALLRQILADLLADLERPRAGRLSPAVSRMEDRPESRPSLGELSALCGLSRKHFTRLFQAAYGTTPSRYARRQRIERARLLLEETTLSVDAVAAELGYPDRFAFSKQFKSVLGITPGACRR